MITVEITKHWFQNLSGIPLAQSDILISSRFKSPGMQNAGSKNIFYFIITSLIISSATFGQHVDNSKSIIGKVIDKSSGEVIKYASISINKREIGTVADSTGVFELPVHFPSDTVKVSSIGYYQTFLPVNSLTYRDTILIELQKKEALLNEVIVSSFRKKAIYGRNKKSGIIQVTFNPKRNSIKDNLGNEIGTTISPKKPTFRLHNFNFFISSNSFEALRFRVNIYSVNEDKLPDSLLQNENIIYDVPSKSTGWQRVDLEKLNLIFSQPIIISLEWISSNPDNGNKSGIIIPGVVSIGNNTFIRNSSQGIWSKNKVSVSFYATISQ